VYHRLAVNFRGFVTGWIKQAFQLLGCLLIKPWLIGFARRSGTDNNPPNRLLYVAIAYRGDLLLNFPAINAIKRASPNTQIDVWVKEYNVELAQANRNISNVLTYAMDPGGFLASLREVLFSNKHSEFFNSIRRHKYDKYCDDSGTAFTSLVGWRSQIPFRVGRNGQGLGFLNHVTLPHDFNTNLTDKRARLVQTLGNFQIQLEDFSSQHIAISGDRYSVISEKLCFDLLNVNFVTVQAFAGWPSKDWDLKKVLELLQSFCSRTGLTPVMIGSESDAHRLQSIVPQLVPNTVIAAGRLTLLETYALIGRAAFHIGMDSVGSHMAILQNVKSLTIFGPTNPRKITRLDKRHIAVYKQSSCTPPENDIYCCYDAGRSCRDLSCMKDLSVPEVLEAAIDLWQDRVVDSVYRY